MPSEAATASPAPPQELTLTDAIALGAVLVAAEIVGVLVAPSPQRLFPWPHSTYFQRSQLSQIVVLAVVIAIFAAALLALCKLRGIADPLASSYWTVDWNVGLSALVGLSMAAIVSLAPRFLFGGGTGFKDGFAPANILLFIINLVLLQPFLEEFYFRGILFKAVSKRTGRFGTVVATAVAFGLYHIGGYRWILTFITVGVVLAVTRIQTKSIAACFAQHAAYNMGILIFALVHNRL